MKNHVVWAFCVFVQPIIGVCMINNNGGCISEYKLCSQQKYHGAIAIYDLKVIERGDMTDPDLKNRNMTMEQLN